MQDLLKATILVLPLCLSVPSNDASAGDMRATMYADGLACPGDCDAHVVFAAKHNGTRNAFAPPLDSRAAPKKCVRGSPCIICFDDSESSCMEALYRGNGPHADTFDFTPAFYVAECTRGDIPPQLAAKCRELDAAVRKSGYGDRVNCLATPGVAVCTAIVEKAQRQKREDAALRDACLRDGEVGFNARQSDSSKQRALGCNYEKIGTGGPNSHGKTWRRLLPGACRAETYVGRDGLDCCSDQVFVAAALHPECSSYYLRSD